MAPEVMLLGKNTAITRYSTVPRVVYCAASQGTMTHMAPEVMLLGKLSRSSDVYAFGVLLWELYTAQHAFKGIPRALLGHEVAHRQRRPQFPEGSLFDYQLLACR
jgi:serine/threonine protein kinase